MRDTIYARATPPGRSGVAIIRISGPRAVEALSRLVGKPPAPRQVSLRQMRDPRNGEVIDEAVVLHFAAPGSFTGEDVAELQCHGSPAVLRRLVTVLGEQPGLRPAEPGEFTRQALENGRLDLAQVEGLADLLAAETEAQRRQALFVSSGGVSAQAASWRDRLVDILAHVEAAIDYGEDGVDSGVLAPLAPRIRAVADEVAKALEGSAMAERVRDGFTVAICGAPNVGKSTLLNRIAGREAAITSDIPGTTRDILEVHLDLDGLPVTFLDMAGLRDTDDPVEALGVRRALGRIESCDLRVFLDDQPARISAFASHKQEGDLQVLAKSDLGRICPAGLAVSGLTGGGVAELIGTVRAILGERAARSSSVANERQRLALASCQDHLSKATAEADGAELREEILAHHIAQALQALDHLIGRVDVETVLDAVFRNFCLGK